MIIKRVVIREEIVEKIWRKHHVDEDEVREAIHTARTRFKRLEKGRVLGEDLYGAYGQSESGRYLSVFFLHKRNQDAFVISARDMDSKERKRYAKT